jgi:hypothetical protein
MHVEWIEDRGDAEEEDPAPGVGEVETRVGETKETV